jgi:uncharacterized membrane protein YfcA
VSPLHAVLGTLIFGVGACVQGAAGFGSNLIAAPLLVLLSDRFVPGPVVVASGVLNLLLSRRHHIALRHPTLRPAIAGQIVGALMAGAVLAGLPRDAVSLLFAALVLVGVGLTAAGFHLRPTRRVVAVAGLSSGFMGTVSGIGGPPIALAYASLSGPALRATLTRYFIMGSLVTIPTLVVVGQLGADEIVPCLLLLPGALLGFAAAPYLAGHLDRRTARPVVLSLSTVAALAVIVKTLL